jgi:amidase
VPVTRLAIVCLLTWSIGVSAVPSATSTSERRYAVEEKTIAQVHAAIRGGDLTCRQLVDAYLARIAKYDQQGPALNAIASINPAALTEADQLDRAFAERGLTGPLHCVPVIVKDNLETRGWETTAGSLALKGFIPARDAHAIVRLKAAGAIILAKSNTADLALSALTTSNLIRGRTKNPYALNRAPAGSSGGTAVSVAANFGMVGLGTDTGNSARGPAAHASIVGIRPTMGLTSRTGMIPLDGLSDVVGPMARTVEDAAAVLEVLVGRDNEDPATEALTQLPEAPVMQSALGDGVSDLRIGVLRQAYQGGGLKLDPQIAKIFANALNDLKSLGAEVVDSVSVPFVAPIDIAENCQGLKYDLDRYLAGQGELVPMHSLSEIIASGRFDPTIADDLQAMARRPSEGPGSKACEASARYRAAMAAALTSEMDRLQVQLLVYPTWSQLPQLTSDLDVNQAGQSLRFATATGFPAMTVPMGFTQDALPVGLSFLGGAWNEAGLLRAAFAYEQTTRHRRPPVLAPPMLCPCPPGRGSIH